jgi:hypothetical protein
MAYGLAQVRTAQDCGFAFPGRMWLQMLEKIQECDEAIPDAVGYHSRNHSSDSSLCDSNRCGAWRFIDLDFIPEVVNTQIA